jgi:cyclophilin family peptidyl-prolyl cis-trans isomerase
MKAAALWMTGAFLLLAFATAFAQQTGATPSAQPTPKTSNPIVLMKTSMGDIKIELYADKAPITVKNFLDYVDSKFYSGTVFHRVISNFMIQGGGFTKDLNRKETKPAIKNEADNGLSNKRGTIAMARLPEKDTATSQFFINVEENSRLDHFDNESQFGYCVFGQVTEGMDVVDKIRMVKTGAKGPLPKDCPLEPVEILSVTRVTAK